MNVFGLLIEPQEVGWTVLSLMKEDGPEKDLLRQVTRSVGCTLLEEEFEDRGHQPTYSSYAPQLRRFLQGVLNDRRIDGVVTHSREEFLHHPFRWQVYNAVATCAQNREILCFGAVPERPVITWVVSAETERVKRQVLGRIGIQFVQPVERFHPMFSAADEYEDLRHKVIHGQVIQEPQNGSPGILISPFWEVFPGEMDRLGRLMQDEALVGEWYLIMADTYFCNHPPHYILPMIRGRFCVDETEGRFFAKHFPGIDVLQICQSHMLSADLYRPIPGIKKDFDLVYNARFGYIKRHELLLDALEHLHSRGHNFKVLFMHYPKDNDDTRKTSARILQRIEQSPVDITLFTTGGRGNDEETIVRMLNRCRFGVLMSSVEGPSFVFAEYLLCDLPVVAYGGLKGGGLFFLDETNSRLFEREDDVADALLWMVEHYTELRPRESALAKGIGVLSGNARLRQELAKCGMYVREDAELAERHLSHVSLSSLLGPNVRTARQHSKSKPRSSQCISEI